MSAHFGLRVVAFLTVFLATFLATGLTGKSNVSTLG